jgi:tetratricopeptide (TPR) repeat protein
VKTVRLPFIALWAVLMSPCVSLCASPQMPSQQLSQANAALQAGEADKALDLLRSLSTPPDEAAAARNLECRVRYSMEQWDAAANICEQAVRLDSQNALYHLWLGRALGEKADRASFLTAYSLAKRVRSEFEESVRLNPGDPDALADLGEFYQQAPQFLGGGNDKAEGIASRLDAIDAARAHELRGHIAVGRKDYEGAEREFKQAIVGAAHPASHWISLAGFYRDRQRLDDMESAIHSGVAAASRDKHAGIALYDGASVLARAHRNLALAATMLQDYLDSPFKNEEAPAFVAHVRLARLKQQLGDLAAAARERAAALTLAHEYKPAQELNLQQAGTEENRH